MSGIYAAKDDSDTNLRFFEEELLKNHYSTFNHSVLIAASGKLRRVSGQNQINDAFQDACVLALSGECKDFCPLIAPLREMTEATTATSGQQAAFEALEIVLGTRKDVPEAFQKSRAQARQFVGYFAGVMFNTVRTSLKTERRRSEIVAANADSIIVHLNHNCDDPGARAEATSVFNRAAADELRKIARSYGRRVRDMFAAVAFVHITTEEPVDTLITIIEDDYDFGFPFSRMTIYRAIKTIRKNLRSLDPGMAQ